MHQDIIKINYSKEKIEQIVKCLGEKISIDYKDKNPLFLGLLKGCLPFMTDLVKNIDIYCNLEYVKVSSYDGTHSTGNVEFKGEIPNVNNRDVILVDDILDTGRTIQAVKTKLMAMGAKSVSVCVLLDKPTGRLVDIKPDYVGGIVPNEFVVGYGLDYNEHYRNLPYIGVLKDEVYSK